MTWAASSSGRSNRSTAGERAAQMPSGMAIIRLSTTATSTWLSVSIARSHTCSAAMPTKQPPHSAPSLHPPLAHPMATAMATITYHAASCRRSRAGVRKLMTRKSLNDAVPPTIGHAVAEVLVDPVGRVVDGCRHVDRPRVREVVGARNLGDDGHDEDHADAGARTRPRCAQRLRHPRLLLARTASRALAGGDPVEGDRREHDRQTSGERLADVDLLQPAEHVVAHAARADQRRVDDDAERHHDHLVDARAGSLAGPAAGAP